ncbi:MAG TPA: flagellar hook capping FlgD N-terminal domain-containing protein [Terriglobia bacterium]|nr:flagellar hook capping FlgD N-terminal domain-containing protein [Terriglobia bacterium]
MATINSTNPLAAATTSTSLQPKSKSEEQKSQFLKLLVAQLKGQNPLDPKDGTEFVSQLAQFSSLEELINIRTALENGLKPATTDNSSVNSTVNPFNGGQK